jgi:hypothetical protein
MVRVMAWEEDAYFDEKTLLPATENYIRKDAKVELYE